MNDRARTPLQGATAAFYLENREALTNQRHPQHRELAAQFDALCAKDALDQGLAPFGEMHPSGAW